jgi:hypothetical protein
MIVGSFAAARLFFLALALTLVLATGCGSLSNTSRDSDVGELPTSRLNSGMDALYEGRLAGDVKSGCVWLVDPYERLTVIWPNGFSVRWDPLRVYRPGGELLAREGDLLRMGGGRLGSFAWEKWASDPVKHCRVSEDVWLAANVERIQANS